MFIAMILINILYMFGFSMLFFLFEFYGLYNHYTSSPSTGPLHIASRDGDLNMIVELISNGWDVNEIDVHSGYAPLHYAVENNHVAAATALIGHGADVNIVSKGQPMTFPVILAMGREDATMLQLLVNHGATVNAADSNGYTALHLACHKGYSVATTLLIQRNADVNAMDSDLWRPIHYAVINNRVQLVNILIHSGADLNVLNRNGSTPLLLACTTCNVDIGKLLLAHGADANQAGSNKLYPLVTASAKGCRAMVELLLQSTGPNKINIDAAGLQGWTALHWAADIGREDIVALLVDGGADLEKADNKGLTALHWAAYSNRPKVATYLLHKGASPEAKTKDGKSAVQVAVLRGHREILPVFESFIGMTEQLFIAIKNSDLMAAENLLDHGIKIDCKNSEGMTPLLEAASIGNPEMVSLLIQRGADIRAADNNRRRLTPLIMASLSNRESIVRLLINRGKFGRREIDQRDAQGWASIHWAADRGHVEVARVLLAHGGDVNVQDSSGWTATHWAADQNRLDMLKFLLSQGGDVTAKDVNGSTPLHLASRRGHVPIVTGFISHLRHGGSSSSSSRSSTSFTSTVRKRVFNARDKWGMTPLMIAIAQSVKGSSQVASLLLDGGADVNAATDIGRWTPIFFACVHSLEGQVKALIVQGAKVNLVDASGRSPLHITAEQGDFNLGIITMLLEKGADVNLKDNYGLTAAALAKKRGQPKAHALLTKFSAVSAMLLLNQLSSSAKDQLKTSKAASQSRHFHSPQPASSNHELRIEMASEKPAGKDSKSINSNSKKKSSKKKKFELSASQ